MKTLKDIWNAPMSDLKKIVQGKYFLFIVMAVVFLILALTIILGG